MKNLGHLKERLSSQIEQDRQHVESLTRNEFEILSKNLRSSAKKEFNSIKNDFQNQHRSMKTELEVSFAEITRHINEMQTEARKAQKSANRKWMIAGLMTTFILVSILALNWGLMHFKLDRLRTLNTEIDERTEIHSQMKTWGITLLESGSGRYIVLPPGWTFGQQLRTNDGKPAYQMLPQ